MKDKIVSLLIQARELYSQAGDESNTSQEYYLKHDEARQKLSLAIGQIRFWGNKVGELESVVSCFISAYADEDIERLDMAYRECRELLRRDK